jgi:hypothetical protein
MPRRLSILVAGAAAAAAILATASPAPAATINPPPPPGGQIMCLTCPPDLVVSWHLVFVTWYVEITNLGGQSPQASTASVTYGRGSRWLRDIRTASIPVAPLGAGETRTVYTVNAVYWSPIEACADVLGNVPEKDETNNCA